MRARPLRIVTGPARLQQLVKLRPGSGIIDGDACGGAAAGEVVGGDDRASVPVETQHEHRRLAAVEHGARGPSRFLVPMVAEADEPLEPVEQRVGVGSLSRDVDVFRREKIAGGERTASGIGRCGREPGGGT